MIKAPAQDQRQSISRKLGQVIDITSLSPMQFFNGGSPQPIQGLTLFCVLGQVGEFFRI
jgi:hypothetical protein